MKRSDLTVVLTGAILLLLNSCASTIPVGAVAVKPFDKEKYLGKWYEIARMEFKFEKNQKNITATYSVNPNGTIKVDNRGYDTVAIKWKEAIGKAKFVKDPMEAKLKVSFFGPFYGGYNVIALDPDYRYALVAGGSLKYLWILAREKSIPDDIRQKYLAIAAKVGYPTAELIWTEQD